MFGFFKRKNVEKPNKSQLFQAEELFTVLDERLDRIDGTADPDEFFSSYKTAVELCGKILSFKLGDKYDAPILEILHGLFADKTERTNAFLKRCSRSGVLSYSVDKIISHKDDMTEESYSLFAEMTGINELLYTYVSVSFGGEKPYHYICEYPDVKVGDEVIVPVGKEELEKYATVVSVESCTYDNAPYPVSKAKKVIMILNKEKPIWTDISR